MIDNPVQVERLMDRLEQALPFPALATPELLATLRDNTTTLTPPCTVTKLFYFGDEGGIMCHVSFQESTGSNVVIASITHLEFDRRLPVAREIAVYQKHRVKRLRKQHARDAAMEFGAMLGYGAH